jgi:5'(3')-deoxyribonucleotidase
MQAKQIIAFDIDDVLAETHENTRLWTNKMAGSAFTKEDFQQPGEYWGYYLRIWAEHGLSDILKQENYEEAMAQDLATVPLMAGASFAISELQKKFKIILITSRAPVLEGPTREWVNEHFADYDIELYFASNPNHGQLSERKTKGELCKELGASILIDDNPEHCQSALDAGIEPVLFGEYGWHQTIPEGVTRCKDWPAVLEYLDGRQ